MALITDEQIEAINENINKLNAEIEKLNNDIAAGTTELKEIELQIQNINAEISSVKTLIPRFEGDKAKQDDLRAELGDLEDELASKEASAKEKRDEVITWQAELVTKEAELVDEENSPILATYNRQLAAREEYGEIPVTDEEWETLLSGQEDASRIQSLESDTAIFVKTVDQKLALSDEAEAYVKEFSEKFNETEGNLTTNKSFNDARAKLLDITIPLASIQLAVDNGLTSIQFTTSELNPLQMKTLQEIGYLFTYDFDIVGNMVITCDWSMKPEEEEEEEGE